MTLTRVCVFILLVGCGSANAAPGQQVAATSTAATAITLDEAIQRAKRANSAYSTAVADAGTAQAQKTITRSALLPGVVYHNQYLYTQGHGSTATANTGNSIRFVGNNAVHEYVSQGIVTESLGAAGFANLKKADADAAAARARLEVARRGLVTTVVGNFYGVVAATEKLAVAQRALGEAEHFSKLTRQREDVGEVAHADTVRGDIQSQQRQRELNDARLASDRARLDLGVLLFDNPAAPYTTAASLTQLPALPSRAEIDTTAREHNPDLKAAMETLHAASLDVTASRFAYLPDLTMNYYYGIDAAQFAVHGPDGSRNLGYAASATLDIPVWDWFATKSRVKQSVLRREQARVELTITQRQLLASLNELYQEAEVSLAQLALLDQSVDSAKESLRLSNLRYAAGDGNVLEIVDSQNVLLSAENSRVDGAVRYYTALAMLQTLTGKMPQ